MHVSTLDLIRQGQSLDNIRLKSQSHLNNGYRLTFWLNLLQCPNVERDNFYSRRRYIWIVEF